MPPASPAVEPDRTVVIAVVVLAAVSVGGAFISVVGGLADSVLEAMGPTGRLSVPFPLMLAQLVVGWVASGHRRRGALVASALLAVVAPMCIASGFFDGGYSDPGRRGAHTAYQGLLVTVIAFVGIVAARRVFRLRRQRSCPTRAPAIRAQCGSGTQDRESVQGARCGASAPGRPTDPPARPTLQID